MMIGKTKFSSRRIPAAEFILLLFTAVSVSAQVPADWTVNPSAFEHIMTVTAQLEINGSVQGDSNDVVAAFTGNECRGVAAPINVLGQWLYFMMVRANGNGELILFKVWDADLDTVIDATNQILFAADEAYGTVNVPYIIDAINTNLSTESVIGFPTAVSLFQNYPNPFNPITTIGYDLPWDSYVQITIYDILGRQIIRLIDEHQQAGYKSIDWNSTNTSGQQFSAGVYLYQVKAGDFLQTKKMILLK